MLTFGDETRTGLAGLVAAALGVTPLWVTDGHPEAARTLASVVRVNKARGLIATTTGPAVVEACHLVWTESDLHVETSPETAGSPRHHHHHPHHRLVVRSDSCRGARWCMAADVAFFEAYHWALLDTTASLVQVHSSPVISSVTGDDDSAVEVGSTATATTTKTTTAMAREAGSTLRDCRTGREWTERELTRMIGRSQSLVLLAPSRGGSLERLLDRATTWRGLTVREADERPDHEWAITVECQCPVSDWMSTALGWPLSEGSTDPAVGPLQLVVLQFRGSPAPIQ